MKRFARMTKLTDIVGRADYISNPNRQEKIVLMSEPIDWKPYADYEKFHQRSREKNNEGREVMIPLPNEWESLPQEELKKRAQELAELAVGKKTDLQWSIHWNKSYSNLHMHVMFSERRRDKNSGVYTQDVYLKDDGTVARYKKDRAKNEDGTFKPPIHRKGDSKGDFTAKDKKYVDHLWAYHVKNEIVEKMKSYGVKFDPPAVFHEYHEGKGDYATRWSIVRKNEIIRECNENWEWYCMRLPYMSEKKIKHQMLEMIKDEMVPQVTNSGELISVPYKKWHLQKVVDEMIEKHEKWLRGEKDGHRADFQNKNLSGFDLSNADLSYAMFEDANLYGTSFYKTKLTAAAMSGANLTGADLDNAVLPEEPEEDYEEEDER